MPAIRRYPLDALDITHINIIVSLVYFFNTKSVCVMLEDARAVYFVCILAYHTHRQTQKRLNQTLYGVHTLRYSG